MMSHDEFYPYFLGPYGENADLFEDLLVDFVRDHVYWRRNFHPESTPPIPTTARHQDDFVEVVARMRRELFSLSADLKKSVPWFSPRYVGHMASDLLLPGLIANLVTTLYNPNNVTEQAAPVTVDKELDVGFQLAEMFGFSTDPEQSPCAWGHLTSGGTVANYEGLYNLAAVKRFPLALKSALAELELDLQTPSVLDEPLTALSDWQVANLTVDTIVELRRDYLQQAAARGDETLDQLRAAIDRHRFETLGAVDFYRAHPDLEPPVVLVPKTSHYSWPKAMKVLGLGTSRLVPVGVDENMRMDLDDLRATLDRLAEQRVPVLSLVAILGTTEFGTVDPIGDIVAERRARLREGQYFPIHVDAAWGGYLASIFRRPDGGLVNRDRLRKEFHYFPSQTVYEAFASLSEVDSITVDPHKLGYIPYPAGAYVARHAGMIDFVVERAPYAFDDAAEEAAELRRRLKNLGQYILEGSKPGASAASVHVTHNVMPLHTDEFGALLKETVRASEYFYDRVGELADRLDDRVTITVPFEPDCNLICLALNPVKNRSAARANEFVRAIYNEMRVDASRPARRRRSSRSPA
ncbi:MAG: pyridoxal phosphate-dependent decarboxylase family protein, partial [Persicimonas sp.]